MFLNVAPPSATLGQRLCIMLITSQCPQFAASVCVNNFALRRFLHNHGNIATEENQKSALYPTLICNDFKGSL